ncbi:heat shock 70 kDa protein 12A-like [Argopecten irradians]|uniref:heat shock 70 kDa protein 12A-like n=1 Tax=Argopecten irradians TaxID=31199 RepID=UPI00371E1A25
MASPEVCVVAIDIGTTATRYAYSLKHDYMSDPGKIVLNCDWPDGKNRYIHPKAPTCVLLKPDKSFHSFGLEAACQYTDLCEENEQDDWYFFQNFKTTLCNTMKLRRSHTIPDITGKKSLPARDVFAHIITYLKDDMVENVRKTIEHVDDDFFRWVLTVPDLWDVGAKTIIQEAALQSGIKEQNLIIALQSEAAVQFCDTLPEVEKQETGTEYMVLHIGAKSVDVTVQRTFGDRNQEKMFQNSDTILGGILTEDSFFAFLAEIFGTDVMRNFTTKCTWSAFDLIKDFEVKKRKITNVDSNPVKMSMPCRLFEMCENEFGTSIREHIEHTLYKGRIRTTADKLLVDLDIFKNVFTLPIKSAVGYINNLFKTDACKNVSTLLLVGGFFECILIQDAIRKNFPDKRIIIPEDSGLAVVKGAVLFGHSPPSVRYRVLRFTYGISTTRKFEPGDPIDNKVIVRDEEFCRGIFTKHVGIGQTVAIGETFETKKYRPLHKKPKSVTVRIFISSEDNPRYTTSPFSQLLGAIDVPLSSGAGENTVIEVRMKFLDTELICEACEENSTSVSANLRFPESENSDYDLKKNSEADIVLH